MTTTGSSTLNTEVAKRFDPGDFYGYKFGGASDYIMKCKPWFPKVGLMPKEDKNSLLNPVSPRYNLAVQSPFHSGLLVEVSLIFQGIGLKGFECQMLFEPH